MGAKASRPAAASDQDFIPADMAELAEHYYDFIRGMVRKAGISDQDAQDSVQYILERLEVTGAIGQYDPEHVVMHQGQPRKSRFSTFLGAKVLFYCRGERGRVTRRDSHELKILDAPAYELSDGQAAGHLGELLGAAVLDDYSVLESAEVIRAMRSKLAAVPPRSARDKCDLVALFDEIVAEIERDGGYSYAGLRARFGISGTTAGAWLSRLRSVLSAELGRPLVTVGGVPLTAEQVAAAVKVLREAPGIMVAQPLARAGHPLSEAAKRWYHPFSAEEIKKYPHLAIEPGTHRKPAGHVKTAVIHRLERILAEAGQQAPDPQIPAPRRPAPCESGDEPEITLEEEFEALLWRGIHDPAELEQVKAMARRVYAVSALWASG